MTAVIEGTGGSIHFSDLVAWLEGFTLPLSKVISVAKNEKGFQANLALWVYRPLKQIIKAYSSPLRDLVHIPWWLFNN